ncbi:OmpA family protein [Sagittula sp. NFXS13]|uniref:Outer membrane protein OmpA-like peptidoglycan-associated protein n=1 Tax=Sagittula marina TaxID=943940 RepID=A0A7W6GRF2_9RHOB|nr:OmpA family protein [Sagittula marina]MBB3984647.1 outer membrane protein OmpA-like peptidoglycan-associated protein [Sagittula marina]
MADTSLPRPTFRLALSGMAMGLLVSGCSSSTQSSMVEGFRSDVGASVDTGAFGNATMNNHQYMTGEKTYVYELSQRFASEVMTTVNFAFNSSVLDQGGVDTLREQARWIRQFPEATFRVYGHTDKVGGNGYNKALGLARANTVVNFLVSQGISRSRLEAVVSFGETQPLIVTEGRERRNRRTVTEVSGFVGRHPTVLEGKYAEIIYREYINSAEPSSSLNAQTGNELSIGQ